MFYFYFIIFIQVYYSAENTREYHEVEEQYLEVDSDLAPAIDCLITSYPHWTKVINLYASFDQRLGGGRS